ncbi:hypothetical protein ACJJTC_003077 [Scirpophaga incertulas]
MKGPAQKLEVGKETTRKRSAATDNEDLSPFNQKLLLTSITADIDDVHISLEVIGRTAEYNDIILLKAKAKEDKADIENVFRADNSKYAADVNEKKIIFIVHGLSVKGIKYLKCLHENFKLKALLNLYFAHINKFDIFIIPMANPDGFANNRDEIWDKNMSPRDGCQGVNLDRNFDVAWNGTFAKSSCSQQYPGPKPFSEPETRAIREVFHHYGHKIVGYINVHSSTFTALTHKGDAVLYPKGFTDEQVDDDHYIDLKAEIEEAMRDTSFQVVSVTVDTLYNWYGTVTGTSVDYASTVYGVPYALEFLMQPYIDDGLGENDELDYVALIEIWKRVIDTTFINIYAKINSTETWVSGFIR